MQVRAIIEAACELDKEGVKVLPEIMIPLVGHQNEIKTQKKFWKSSQRSFDRHQSKVQYKFGTMIEIPRAAVVADQIAEYAEFFSFGTNDLTQMTFGYSRDDAEGKFLFFYEENGILPEDPFQSIDLDGVGELMKMGVQKGDKSDQTSNAGSGGNMVVIRSRLCSVILLD